MIYLWYNYDIKTFFNIIANFILPEALLCERWNNVRGIIMIKYFAGVKGLIKNEKVNTSKCESIRNCFFLLSLAQIKLILFQWIIKTFQSLQFFSVQLNNQVIICHISLNSWKAWYLESSFNDVKQCSMLAVIDSIKVVFSLVILYLVLHYQA